MWERRRGIEELRTLESHWAPVCLVSHTLSHTHHMYIQPRQKALCNQTECPLPRQQGLEELRVPRETWAVPAAMSVAPE